MSEPPDGPGSSRRPTLKRKVNSPILFDSKHPSQSKCQGQRQEPFALDLGYTHTPPTPHLHPRLHLHLPRTPTPTFVGLRFVPFHLLFEYVYSTRRALGTLRIHECTRIFFYSTQGTTFLRSFDLKPSWGALPLVAKMWSKKSSVLFKRIGLTKAHLCSSCIEAMCHSSFEFNWNNWILPAICSLIEFDCAHFNPGTQGLRASDIAFGMDWSVPLRSLFTVTSIGSTSNVYSRASSGSHQQYLSIIRIITRQNVV